MSVVDVTSRPVAQTTVYAEDGRAFVVSTVYRGSSARVNDPPWYYETLIWEWLPKTKQRGALLYQITAGQRVAVLNQHADLCRRCAEGKPPTQPIEASRGQDLETYDQVLLSKMTWGPSQGPVQQGTLDPMALLVQVKFYLTDDLKQRAAQGSYDRPEVHTMQGRPADMESLAALKDAFYPRRSGALPPVLSLSKIGGCLHARVQKRVRHGP